MSEEISGERPQADRPARPISRARRQHSRSVLEALRDAGIGTQGMVAQKAQLSRGTVSNLLSQFEQDGLVVRVPGWQPTPPPKGRPPSGYALAPSAAGSVGVDCSGDGIRLAVADLEGIIKAERWVRLTEHKDVQTVMGTVAELVEAALAEARLPRSVVIGIEMGVPSPVDLDGRLTPPTIDSTWINSQPGHMLNDRLVELRVEVDNDANLSAYAEMLYGAARDYTNVIYVQVKTGIGCGLIVDGCIYRGSRGIAGELGHTLVKGSTATCRCGRKGCLEASIGPAGIIESLMPAHADRLFPPDVPESGRTDIDRLSDIITWAHQGDQSCRQALRKAGQRLGFALANLCTVFDPHCVVIGGLLRDAGELVVEPIQKAIDRYSVSTSASNPPVVAGSLAHPGVRGALALVIRGERKQFSDRLLEILEDQALQPSAISAATRGYQDAVATPTEAG